MLEHTTTSEKETEELAATWANSLAAGAIVTLTGELGAGKTCFCRGFLKGLGGDPETVSSPSFALVNEYDSSAGTLYHWDLYRLEPNIDWSVLDLEDHLCDASAFTLIEWPEKHPDLNKNQVYHVHIDAIDETQRIIKISAPSAPLR